MRSLVKSSECPLCGKSRRWADHTECSKKLQKQASANKTRASKRVSSKACEAYFSELLKRIGE